MCIQQSPFIHKHIMKIKTNLWNTARELTAATFEQEWYDREGIGFVMDLQFNYKLNESHYSAEH